MAGVRPCPWAGAAGSPPRQASSPRSESPGHTPAKPGRREQQPQPPASRFHIHFVRNEGAITVSPTLRVPPQQPYLPAKRAEPLGVTEPDAAGGSRGAGVGSCDIAGGALCQRESAGGGGGARGTVSRSHSSSNCESTRCVCARRKRLCGERSSGECASDGGTGASGCCLRERRRKRGGQRAPAPGVVKAEAVRNVLGRALRRGAAENPIAEMVWLLCIDGISVPVLAEASEERGGAAAVAVSGVREGRCSEVITGYGESRVRHGAWKE
ncbi:hypothetical protein BC834DRAFT_844830 [Gloeopeniophorella convolvens]|nr:hypothetical protein BC834DRAFT_844830 [Gloeopeniophorella convolvens]